MSADGGAEAGLPHIVFLLSIRRRSLPNGCRCLLVFGSNGRNDVSRRAQRSAFVRMAVSAVAAYAFILQVLLGSVVATRMALSAPADAMAICTADSHAGDDPSGEPTTRLAHATCMVCAFASFVPPLPEAATILLGVANEFCFQPEAPAYGRHAGRHEPRSSRGPPQTV
jgi:hypothetical protein